MKNHGRPFLILMACWVSFLWGGIMINGMDHLVGDDQGIKFPLEMEEVFQRTDLEREREIEEGKTLYLKFSPEIKEMLRSAAEDGILFRIGSTYSPQAELAYFKKCKTREEMEEYFQLEIGRKMENPAACGGVSSCIE
jgi:hypothetical protein